MTETWSYFSSFRVFAITSEISQTSWSGRCLYLNYYYYFLHNAVWNPHGTPLEWDKRLYSNLFNCNVFFRKSSHRPHHQKSEDRRGRGGCWEGCVVTHSVEEVEQRFCLWNDLSACQIDNWNYRDNIKQKNFKMSKSRKQVTKMATEEIWVATSNDGHDRLGFLKLVMSNVIVSSPSIDRVGEFHVQKVPCMFLFQ